MEELDMKLIDRYLAGEATSEERRQVEQKIASDPSFQKELQAYQSIVEEFKIRERSMMKARLQNLEKKISAKPTGNNVMRFRSLVLAAAASLLLCFLGWKFLINMSSSGTPFDGNQLYAENFSPYRADMTEPLEKGGDSISALDQFNIDYWNAKYPLAVAGFDSIDPELQQNDNLRFRYANALLAAGELDKAEEIFKSILANNQSTYVNETHWYLALIAIKKEEREEARDHLKAYVGSSGAVHKDQATRLLSKVK